MRRVGIRIANVALFTLCCFLVAEVFNDISAEFLMVAQAAAPPPAVVESHRIPGWDERRPIIERNLFNAQIAAVPALPPSPVDEPLTATELPLRLLGTVLSLDDAVSRATLEDKSSRKHEVLRTGDSLQAYPDVQLTVIERGRVILLNEGRREELRLQENSAPTAPAPKRTAKRSRSRRSSRTKTASLGAVSDSLKDLQSDSGLSRTAADLLTQGKLAPKYHEGEMVGIQISDIEPGSLYEKIGIENDDVITSVNGIPLDSAAAGGKILPQLTRDGEIPPIQINIDGKESITVDPEQLLEFGLLGP
jgi:type II secretion system protein C